MIRLLESEDIAAVGRSTRGEPVLPKEFLVIGTGRCHTNCAPALTHLSRKR